MAPEFEDQDLSDAIFWAVDLRRTRFRDVDFTGVRTQHVILCDVEFDGTIDSVVINGVDVTDYVNRHDPWQPLRSMQEPVTADEVRRSWTAFTQAWDDTIAQALTLPAALCAVSVDGEWSFTETLRHLLFVADKWVLGPVAGGAWSPIGLPNSGSADFDWPNIDPTSSPTMDDVLTARQGQIAALSALATTMDDARLAGEVTVLENGSATVRDCWHVLFEEAFEHLRYARRDLDQLMG